MRNWLNSKKTDSGYAMSAKGETLVGISPNVYNSAKELDVLVEGIALLTK